MPQRLRLPLLLLMLLPPALAPAPSATATVSLALADALGRVGASYPLPCHSTLGHKSTEQARSLGPDETKHSQIRHRLDPLG